MVPDVKHPTTPQEEKALSPASPMQMSSPATPRRDRRELLRILAVAVAAVGGIPLGLCMGPHWAALCASVAGALLHSWWASLIVPVAALAGSFVLMALLGAFDPVYWVTHGFDDAFYLVVDPLVPSVLAALVGVAAGEAIARSGRR